MGDYRITHEYDNISQEITIRNFKNLLVIYEKYITMIKSIITNKK